MADIAGFRGVLYDSARVEASKVLAPPYDVIDPTERQRLADLDPHNCVRVILPEGEGEGDQRYTNAAQFLKAWIAEGVLRRDPRPAIYRYNQVFTHDDLGAEPVTRRGFIAAVRLHRFDERVILPHERTLKGPKIDRLKLFKATQSHPSQIFTLYSDPQGEADAALAAAESQQPVIDGLTEDGTRHIVWRVDDPQVIARVAQIMAGRHLYIADGHHRYETMLAYRDYRREQGDSSADFGTLFLANMDDPGLIVLPTHRLVHSLPSFSLDDLRRRAAESFAVTTVTGAAVSANRVRALLAEHGQRAASLALVVPGNDDVTLLTYKGAASGASAVEQLDVALLHTLIFEQILGIDRAAQEAKTNLEYIKDTGKALAAIADGQGQACFLMNPTPVAQVRAVSDAGECMPQKSTFFYPKIASGVVWRVLDEVIG
jgi:uncharacterized protein (DUF1015 family)